MLDTLVPVSPGTNLCPEKSGAAQNQAIAISSTGCYVGHPLAYQKGVMGLVIRTIGLAHANATITLANMACNMKRWCWLDRRAAPA
jgi:hypothetical protein